jgi:hypothetical protein
VNSANSILEHEQTIASWKGGSQKATRADVRLTRLRARKAMSASFRQNRGQTPGGWRLPHLLSEPARERTSSWAAD